MANYVTMPIIVSNKYSNYFQKFHLLCDFCREQSNERVVNDIKLTLAKGADHSPVERFLDKSQSKAFLDKVCGGDCGKVIAQYQRFQDDFSQSLSSLILQPTATNEFLVITYDAIRNLNANYNTVSCKYESAKSNAVFFDLLKIAAQGSNISSLGGTSFSDEDRKILKIILDSPTIYAKLKSIMEYFKFIDSQRSYKVPSGTFYDFKAADEFMRSTENYSWIQVDSKYEAADIVADAAQLTITFSYNEKFFNEVKNFVYRYAINRDECIDILNSIDPEQINSISQISQEPLLSANINPQATELERLKPALVLELGIITTKAFAFANTKLYADLLLKDLTQQHSDIERLRKVLVDIFPTTTDEDKEILDSVFFAVTKIRESTRKMLEKIITIDYKKSIEEIKTGNNLLEEIKFCSIEVQNLLEEIAAFKEKFNISYLNGTTGISDINNSGKIIKYCTDETNIISERLKHPLELFNLPQESIKHDEENQQTNTEIDFPVWMY